MYLRILPRLMLLAACLLWLGLAVAQTGDQIDWKRAQQLHQKFVRGEKLTKWEQAYHDKAAKALQAKSKQDNQSPPAKPPTGMKPLCDMTAADHYKGEDGGLYGGGKNEPSAKHLQAAMQEAEMIRPRDARGKPSDDGKIVLISLGMSNTTQEFSTFVRLANDDAAKSRVRNHRSCSGGRTFGPMGRRAGRSTIWFGSPKTWGRMAPIPASGGGGRWPSCC